jgi:hypothetical protein
MVISKRPEWRKCDDVLLKGSSGAVRWGGATRRWHLADKACEYLLASAIAPVLFFLFQTHLAFIVEH